VSQTPILLGTSSFTASGWNGSFYPRGTKPSDYLPFYADRFQTVEIDSTFYACPAARTVENWNARTPDGFVFSGSVSRRSASMRLHQTGENYLIFFRSLRGRSVKWKAVSGSASFIRRNLPTNLLPDDAMTTLAKYVPRSSFQSGVRQLLK
jgi:Protein of unknown function DUF72